MIIIADMHLREDAASIILDEVLPGIYQACLESGENHVAILGDVFHFRYKIDVRLQNALRDEFQKWYKAGINVTILPGNHDQYEIGGRNALEVFDDMENVKVYSVPTWDENGFWIPYRKDPNDIIEALKIAGNGPRVLFLHHGIKGSWMNDLMQDDEGIDIENFKTWDFVFCGHYHKPQQIQGKPYYYIGSPWQTSEKEAGQQKGYAVWKAGKYEFKNAYWGPRIHKFELKPGEVPDLTGISPRDEVRIKTIGADSEKAAVEIGKMLNKAGITRQVCTPEIKALEARLDVAEGSSAEQYAKAYVFQSDTSLNKSRLLDVFREITQ